MGLKIELRIGIMLRILYSDFTLTATLDSFKNTDRWIIVSFLWEEIICMADYDQYVICYLTVSSTGISRFI